MMDLYAVFSEWDIGLNIDGRTGCYSSEESLEAALNSVCWESLEYDDYHGATEDQVLTIEIIKG